jgi:hypothetical protein
MKLATEKNVQFDLLNRALIPKETSLKRKSLKSTL